MASKKPVKADRFIITGVVPTSMTQKSILQQLKRFGKASLGLPGSRWHRSADTLVKKYKTKFKKNSNNLELK